MKKIFKVSFFTSQVKAIHRKSYLNKMSETPAEVIQSNLALVKAAIEEEATKLPNSKKPVLVAVSKTKPEADILAAYQAGQRDFGENYVQELIAKAPNLPSDIRWHFIGHLQSNKAKSILEIPNLYMIHTVDSEKLTKHLNIICSNNNKKIKVLLQINTSGEENKHGMTKDECKKLASAMEKEYPFLEFSGLMTIGEIDASKITHTLQNPNPDFKTLVDLKNEIVKEGKRDPDSIKLSMGMSSDFRHAIEMGSDLVRIGSTIFGPRQYPPGKGPNHEKK